MIPVSQALKSSDDEFVVALILTVLAVAVIAGLVRLLLLRTSIGTKDYSRIDPNKLVCIAQVDDPDEAHYWKETLQAVGIECKLQSEMRPRVYGGICGVKADLTFVTKINLMVRAGDAERALGTRIE